MLQTAYNCASKMYNQAYNHGYSLKKPEHYETMTVAVLESLMSVRKIGFLDNVHKKRNGTILDYAIDAGNVDLVKYISEKLSKEDLNKPCWFAGDTTANALFRSLMSIRCKPSWTSGLSEVERQSRLYRIQEILLDKGVNPNTGNWFKGLPQSAPLSWAVNCSLSEQISLLIDHGAILIDEIWKSHKTAIIAFAKDKTLPRELKDTINQFFLKMLPCLPEGYQAIDSNKG